MEMSPYKLLQEIYFDDPWKSMVCCILLNCTRRTQVNGVVEDLFRIYPTADAMSKAPKHDLSIILRPLGFYNKRAETLKRFSAEWLAGKKIDQIYGVGPYALDSWKIFYENDLTVNPKDGVLTKYVEWKRKQVGQPTAEVKQSSPKQQEEKMTSLEEKILKLKELGIRVRIISAGNGIPASGVDEVCISESSTNEIVEKQISSAIERFESNNYIVLLKNTDS